MGRDGACRHGGHRRRWGVPGLRGDVAARHPLHGSLVMLAGAMLAALTGRAAVIVARGRALGRAWCPARVAERGAGGTALQDESLQTLYAVMLELELAAEDIGRDPEGARERVDRSIDRLSGVIESVRPLIQGRAPVG